jgi:hypothetical protein
MPGGRSVPFYLYIVSKVYPYIYKERHLVLRFKAVVLGQDCQTVYTNMGSNGI